MCVCGGGDLALPKKMLPSNAVHELLDANVRLADLTPKNMFEYAKGLSKKCFQVRVVKPARRLLHAAE